MKFGLFRRKFGKALIAVIIMMVASTGTYILLVRLFSIRYIEVIGSDVQVIVDQKRISKNLLFFPSDKFRSEILESNPLLSDVRFEKAYPSTLKIITTVRSPFVRLQSQDRLVLIDRTGIVLQDGDRNLPLPLIEMSLTPFRVGEKLNDPRVVLLLPFIDKFGESLSITTVIEREGTYFQVKTAKTDIYITQDKPIDQTMATLQTLIDGFRIKGTLPAVVDLRFDKPIVKI
jgi:cell division septal protein FtsQ